jgi:hypothetical protein
LPKLLYILQDVADIIKFTKFLVERSRDFLSTGARNSHISIETSIRTYHNATLWRLHMRKRRQPSKLRKNLTDLLSLTVAEPAIRKLDGCVFVQATGIRIGMLLQTVATIVCSLVTAFIFNWKCAFFVLGILPFKIIGFVMQVRITSGFSMKNKADLEVAGKVGVLYWAN